MNINFTSSAEEYLQNRLKNKNIVDYRFILDYTDGQSPYNDDMIGCHCQDYTKYRLLIVLKNDKNIDEEKYEDYVHSTRSYESCYKDIQDGKYDIMFIMNPVRVEQIRNITAMGERLPEVTISVFPKPSVGVIINLKED